MVFERLEDRQLMSADIATALLPDPVHVGALAPEPTISIEDHTPARPAATAAAADQERSVEILFVDTRVPDHQRLAAAALAQNDGTHAFEVVLLDPGADGVQQISQALVGRRDVDAIHVIAQGAGGGLQLGATWLSADTIAGHAEELTSWRDRLGAGADLVLYGCDVAAGSAGADLLQSLARLTGADVSASIDAAGHDAGSSGGLETVIIPDVQAVDVSTGIVFVDTRVPDYERLIADVLAQRDGNHSVEVVLLDPALGGLQQIGQALAGRSGIDAIHVVAHGSAGGIQLGATWLTEGSLSEWAGEVMGWGDALSERADLLLYGCDVAATAEGRGLVNMLAVLTGADVAASTDLTGAAALGGDWDLEYASGAIETGGPFSAALRASWAGVLRSTPAGGETRLNTTTAGNQTEVAVAMDGAGNYVAVWTSDGNQDGDGKGIYAQRFNAAGVAQGAEFRVNTTTTGDQKVAAVAMDSNGNFVVTWTGSIQDPDATAGVYAQRFNAAGVAQGGEFRVNATTTGTQDLSQVAMDANGNFVVTWMSNQGGTKDIYARRYDAAGAALGGEFLVNSSTLKDQDRSTIAMNASGAFVIAWKTTDPLDGKGAGVFAQRYNSSGVAQGAEFQVNTTGWGNQNKPTVAMAANGDFVIAWVSGNNQDGDNNGVFAQRFNAAGVNQGGEFQVMTFTDDNQDEPSIAIDGSGNFTIAWSSKGPDSGTTKGIYAKTYDATGAVVTGDFLVNTTIAGDQDKPAIAMRASTGDFVVAWQGNGTGDASGVFAQRYQPLNVAPTNTVPGAQTSSGLGMVFSTAMGTAISITDVDAGGGAVQVTLTGTNGTLTLSGVAGLSFSVGDGAADATMTFSGTVGAINTALDGLRFTPTPFFSGAATVQIVTNDLGHSGMGGALTDTDTVTVNVLAPGTPYVLTGSFTGNGIDNRAITGLGFQPDLIIIKARDEADPAVMRSSTMVGDASKEMTGATAFVANEIQSLDANGFTVGTDDTVNKNGRTYDWIAFKASAGWLTVGTYAGNGGASASISGVGFSPDAVFVFDASNEEAVFTNAAAGSSYNFNNGSGSYIGSLDADGFTVGTDDRVNKSGHTYHYIAWNEVQGLMDVGAYTGNDDDNRTIAGVGFQPEYLLVRSGAGDNAVQHFDSQGAGTDSSSLFTGSTAATNRIQALQVDGFQVGSDNDVNNNGVAYSYIAWRQETAPTISGIANQTTPEDTPVGPIAFTIGDTETAAGSLSVRALSSDQSVLADGGIVFGGTGANRTLTLTPVANGAGTTTVTVYVTDGVAQSTVTFTLAVTAVNDAPVLDATKSPTLTAPNEDSGAPVGAVGTLVSSLVDFATPAGQVDNVTGVDSGALLGIAVTAADTTNGTWFYSTNGGTNWNALGAVAGNNARLLAADASTRLYFQPAANWNGTVANAITFRAWDRTSGSNGALADTTTNGGATAFSTATDTASLTVTSVNDAPLITSDGGGATAGVSVAEQTTAVTTVTATDVDVPAQTLTFAIVGGADQARFTINATTGALSFVAAPNYEAPADADANNVYEVTIQVDDGSGGIDTQAISVTVTDVNDAPVITSNGGAATASVSVGENVTAVTTVTATDADQPPQGLTYSIVGGADQARFAIDGGTGALTFLVAPNYEAPTDSNADNVYQVTVQVSDGYGGTDTQVISVTVTDVNEAPVITSNGAGPTAAASVAENTTAVTTVTATDQDRPPQTLTYTIVGGADQAKFAVNATTGALSFLTPPNFENPTDADADNVYEVTVQVSDGAGGTDTQAISVTVTDVNDAPVITSNGGGATAAVSVQENATAVTTVTATDADVPAQTLTYAIVGGADQTLFAIDANTGALTFLTGHTVASPDDADADNVYEVTVRVSDGDGGTDNQAISVTVTASDDPVITSNGGDATAVVYAAENQAAVTTVTATSPVVPQGNLSYSITGGADQARFSIDGNTGVLTFLAAPDFETPTDAGADNVYDVVVQVDDGMGRTDTQAIAVMVTNVNEAPTITSDGAGATAAVSVTENASAVTTVTATDPDVPAQTLTYAIVGGADQARFAINATTGAVTFVTPPSFESPTDANSDNVYEVTVQVSDGAGGIDTQAVSVTVTDANDAPVITSDGGGATASVSVVENTAAVTTVTATDEDVPADTLTFAIVGGADQARFAIDANTGALTFVVAPSYEAPTDADADNVYEVTVRVSDGNAGMDTQAISVAVTDVNDAPVITSNGGGATAAVSVAENTTAVTTVVATDADLPTQSLTYLIVGGADQAKFAIDSSTGALTFVTAPSYETPTDADADNVYRVVVQVIDGNGGRDTQTVDVTVTDANDAPVITSNGGGATANVSVAENQTAVTTVSATDEDLPANTLTFSIVGGADQARFAIDGSTGALTFLTAPNFEAPADANADNVYRVTVQVADGNGGTDTQAISVTVTDANDAPIVTSNGGGATASVSVAENQTAVTTVTATDVDQPAQSLTYAIVGGADQARFTIDASTGVLGFVTPPNFESAADADADNVYGVTVRVSDGAGGMDTQAISVTVTDANDAPIVTSNGGGASASVSVAENQTAVTTVTATDVDQPAQGLTYAIVGGPDQARFTIDASTGVLGFITAPDVETPADADGDNVYLVTVRVSDGNGGIDTQAISVTVTDANDAPLITSNGGGASAGVSVAENQTAVTTVTGTDADLPAQTLAYAIVGGADQARFTLDATTGALRFVAPPSFEAPSDADGDNVYLVTVQVSDGNGGTDTQALAVTVTDANDAPVITSDGGGATADVTAAENQLAVTTVAATDADAPAQALSFAIVGGADQARFAIDAVTGAITFAARPDFEAPADANGDGVYELTVQVSDGAGGTDTQAIRVTVADDNDAPVITAPGAAGHVALTVEEGSSTVATIVATDEDAPAQTLSFAIVGGADQARFTVDAATGVLSFVAPPSHDAPGDADGNNLYEVVVQVSDGHGGVATLSVGVVVEGSEEVLTLVPPEFLVPLTPPPAEPLTPPVAAVEVTPLTTQKAESTAAPTETTAAASEGNGEEAVQGDSVARGPAVVVSRTTVAVDAAGPQPLLAPPTVPAIVTAGAQTTPVVAVVDGAFVSLPPMESVVRLQQVGNGDDGRAEGAGRYRATLQIELRQALDRIEAQLARADVTVPSIGVTTRQVATGSAVVVSSGFLAWVVRGTSLATGLISSAPLWWQVDPLAILSLKERDREARTEAIRAAKQDEDRQNRGLGRLLD